LNTSSINDCKESISLSTSTTRQFFEINTLACEEIVPFPYQKIGQFIQLADDDICPIARKSFRTLRDNNLTDPNPIPYAISYIQCKDGGIFCDGPAATRWLENYFIHPKTKATALKVYLFAQGALKEPFLYITSCSGGLTRDMRHAGIAFDPDHDDESEMYRKNFFTQREGLPRFKMHFADLMPFLRRVQLENPKDPHFLMLEASIYYVGTGSVQKNFAEAARLYEKALTLAPQNREALYRLGQMYRTGGFGVLKKRNLAKKYLRQTCALNPWDHEALATLVSFFCEYKPHKALRALKKTIRLFPDHQFARALLQKLSCDTAICYREPTFHIIPDQPFLHPLFYRTIGPALIVPSGILCPIEKKPLLELRNAHFKKNAFPYLIACIESEKSSIFCDALAAIRHLEKQWTNPQTDDAPVRLSLFIQGAPDEPFIAMTDCEKVLSPEIKRAILAFSTENSLEVYENRARFLDEAMHYNIHRKDLIPLFESAIQCSPKDVSLRFSLANLYYMGSDTLEKDCQKAAALFDSILLIEPRNMNALVRLGTICRRGGWGILKDVPKAEKCLLEAYSINPANTIALNELVELYLQNKDPQKAINLLLDARKKNPHSTIPIDRLASLYYKGSPPMPPDGGQAEKLWQEALHIDPNNAALSCRLAHLYAEGCEPFPRNYAKAKLLYEEVLKKDEGNVEALLGLGNLLFSGDATIPRDLAGAEKLFLKAQQKEQNNDAALTALGKLYYYGGPGFESIPEKAVAYFEDALRQNPQNQEALELLGELLLSGAANMPPNLKRARELLEEAYRLNPSSLVAPYKLAKLYMKGGLGVEKNIARARQIAEEAYQLAPKNPPIIKTLSDVLYEESCMQQSMQSRIELLRRAIAVDPKNWQALACLGTILLYGSYKIAANEEEAIGYLEKARVLHMLPVHTLNLLGQFYLHGGKKIQQNSRHAIDYFEEALQQDASNTVALMGIASLFFFGAKDFPEEWTRAKLYFERTLFCDRNNVQAKRCLAEMLRLGSWGLSSDHREAFDLFGEILNDYPNDCFALVGLGMILLESSLRNKADEEKALSSLSLARNLNPDDVFTASVLHAALLETNNTISINPNMAQSVTLSELFHQDRRSALREIEDPIDTLGICFRNLRLDTSTDEKSEK